MTERLLGARYDLHGGGIDLIFPHHEAEIALAESATGQAPLVNYWMHGGSLRFSGEKMSKSLGNVLGLADALDRWGPGPLRFYYVNTQYRSPIDFDPEQSLSEATEAYRRLRLALERIDEQLADGGAEKPGAELDAALADGAAALVEQLDETLANDFDTRAAVALLFGWSRRLGEHADKLAGFSGASLERIRAPYDWAESVLGLFEEEAPSRPGPLRGVVEVALATRARARARGDFAEADRIREELAAAGVTVEDGAGGSRWRPSDGR